MRITTLIGYLIFSGLCIAAIVCVGGFNSIMDFLDVPSFLIIFGCTLGFILMGKIVPTSNNTSKLKLYQLLTCAFFISAILGDMIGGIQIMTYVTDASVIGPSMAVCLLTSLYGLLAVVLISYPLEDALAKKIDTPNEFSLSHIIWFFFPVYSILFVLLAFYLLMFSASTV